tara:strand:+ start:321 stop:578 length:258 start_codon:yes stop_codon:yes gene_type:complete
MSRKTILSHPAVADIEPAFATGDEYRHEIMLHEGYRFSGYDTHTKHIETLKEGVELLRSIEACPDDCHCKKEDDRIPWLEDFFKL